MFGLGIWELALIAVVALFVLGPEKLPDAARAFGKALRDFRRASDDLKREMIGDLDAPSPRRTIPPNPEAIAKGEPAIMAGPTSTEPVVGASSEAPREAPLQVSDKPNP